MDRFFEDCLASEVKRRLVDERRPMSEVLAFVAQFHSDANQMALVGRASMTCDYPVRLILEAARRLLAKDGFDLGGGPDEQRRTLNASLTKDFGAKPSWLGAVDSARMDWKLRAEVRLAVIGNELQVWLRPALDPWLAQLQRAISALLAELSPNYVERASIAEGAARGGMPREVVLAPGEHLAMPHSGPLRDYSECAELVDVADLAGGSGVLPLGRWAFHKPGETASLGPALKLAPLPAPTSGRPSPLREHQGALICAPQNSGKTELLVEWARAANKAGYNLLIVDVKGNMLDKLAPGGQWQGVLYQMTTDPLLQPGDEGAPSFALNLLDGLVPGAPMLDQQVRQIADALLPSEGLKEGEVVLWRRNYVTWLSALIQLALLRNAYWPREGHAAALADVYDLASSEEELKACIRDIDAAERELLSNSEPIFEPELELWFRDLAVLLAREEIVAADEDLGRPALYGGRVDQEGSYPWLMNQVSGALRPYRRHGLLFAKTGGLALEAEHQFSLDELIGLDSERRPTKRQVTVVLAAREQELEDARSLLKLVIVKLQHALNERMAYTHTGRLPPLLLLLDETRRIRDFKVHEYVSYAREAEAGCVVVYQALDQLGEDRIARELLANIGTQIYLGSLTGTTARLLVEQLGDRRRGTFTVSVGGNEGGAGLIAGSEQVPYFSGADLRMLPAGRYPALVLLRDQPARRPIIVTLDKSLR